MECVRVASAFGWGKIAQMVHETFFRHIDGTNAEVNEERRFKGSSLGRGACIAPMNRWLVAALWQVPQTFAANNWRARFHPSPGIQRQRESLT
jgi:hypothetical protein